MILNLQIVQQIFRSNSYKYVIMMVFHAENYDLQLSFFYEIGALCLWQD